MRAGPPAGDLRPRAAARIVAAMHETLAAEVAGHLRRHPFPGGASWPDGLPESLGRFCAALAAANERLNLTGITDARGMALLHVLDSLLAAPLLGDAATAMDLGSGGGLPGIPLALARPELSMTLVESRERKAAALAALVDELGLAPRITAVHARGERWLADHAVDVVVARAVEALPELLKRLRPVRRRIGRLILLKGPAVDAELAGLERRLASLGFPQPVRHESELPDGAGRRVLLDFRLALARDAG